MIDFTTVVAVDLDHVAELKIVWPTWKKHRPEILQCPLLVICDGDVPADRWEQELDFLDHPDFRRVPFTVEGAEQREKMLTALVMVPGNEVRTPWYLKLDSDVVAAQPGDWLREEWFETAPDGRVPVFVTNPWGYTKPPDAIQKLDDWADHVGGLREKPRLNLVPRPDSGVLSHRRIISWCLFGQTDWTREVAAYAGSRLPVPSQDTYLWYCAARRGDFYRTARMRRVGWNTYSRRRALRQAAEQALNETPPHGTEPPPETRTNGQVRPIAPVAGRVLSRRPNAPLTVCVVWTDEPDYARYTMPCIESYCRRHGYRLELVRDVSASGRSPAWEKLLVAERLGLDFLLVLDLDVCPMAHAGPIDAAVDRWQLNLAPSFPSTWARRRLAEQGLPYDPYRYNTGVMGVPGWAAPLLRHVYEHRQLDPEIAYEQGELNVWLWRSGIAVNRLDQTWNSFWRHGRGYDPRAAFIHLVGHPGQKLERAKALWEGQHAVDPSATR